MASCTEEQACHETLDRLNQTDEQLKVLQIIKSGLQNGTLLTWIELTN